MEVTFDEKKWKLVAPPVVRDHKEHPAFLKEMKVFKPFSGMKDKTDFEDGRNTAQYIGGILQRFFTAVTKAHKAEEQIRKDYTLFNTKLKNQIDAYQIACSNKVQALEEAQSNPNSGIVLREFDAVYQSIDKSLAKLNKESEDLFRGLQKVRKTMEDQIDTLVPKSKESLELIKTMNKELLLAKKSAVDVAGVYKRAVDLYNADWSDMLKAKSSLKKADISSVDKMQDGLQKVIHQLEHNKDEAVKLTDGMKRSIMQAGLIFQGQVKEQDLVAGKLTRMTSRVGTMIQQCENRYDYDASGRIDACEGDLNNYAKFEGEEKEKWREELRHRIPLTSSSIELLESELLTCKNEVSSTIKGFKREQLDLTHPSIKKALELVDTQTQALVKLGQNLAKHKERFAKLTRKAQELGWT